MYIRRQKAWNGRCAATSQKAKRVEKALQFSLFNRQPEGWLVAWAWRKSENNYLVFVLAWSDAHSIFRGSSVAHHLHQPSPLYSVFRKHHQQAFSAFTLLYQRMPSRQLSFVLSRLPDLCFFASSSLLVLLMASCPVEHTFSQQRMEEKMQA